MRIKTNKDLRRIYKRKVDNRMRDYGDTDLLKKVIRVNKKKSNASKKPPVNKHASRYPEVLDTIVHEARHAKHPREHEKTVRKKVREQMKNLSRNQKQRYYSLFKGGE